MDRLIRRQYIYFELTRDVALYYRTCLPCQTSKISRENKTKPVQFDIPEARFQYVHVEIVRPLLISSGYRYLLTMVDRYSRWSEAIPMMEMTAETCARAFYNNWIARFGSSGLITTNHGRQFESEFFNELLSMMGRSGLGTAGVVP